MCTLSLATEFAGDKMTTVNFFGLVLCLMGISVHVVTKATRGGWQNYSVTNLISGNLSSSRYKCQFLINIWSQIIKLSMTYFFPDNLATLSDLPKVFVGLPGCWWTLFPRKSPSSTLSFIWPYYNTFKPCYAGCAPKELKFRSQHWFFSFQTQIVQNWIDSRW